MLRPRIIPVLLIKNGELVKTVNFKNPQYIGDPLNAVRIFNEKEVDELTIFDIDASISLTEPNYKLIEKIAKQSSMPICYGGGIKTVEQANRISSTGVEKIALSSAALDNSILLKKIAEKLGSQSVVVVLDVKKKMFGGYEVFVENGKKASSINLFDFIEEIQTMGVGELLINSIDEDGKMQGFDLELIGNVSLKTTVPLTVLGGAGCLNDIKKVIEKHQIIGVAAGSLFVFKGKYKAVLINYPNRSEKNKLYDPNL